MTLAQLATNYERLTVEHLRLGVAHLFATNVIAQASDALSRGDRARALQILETYSQEKTNDVNAS